MRKEKTIVIEGAGRDAGKVFVVKEMPAVQAEKWAIRLMILLHEAGIVIPEFATNSGMAGVAAHGMEAIRKVNYSSVEPLLDEMLACVQFKPNPAKPLVRPLMPEDLEEIATILQLRNEVFELHTGFSVADLISRRSPSAATTTG